MGPHPGPHWRTAATRKEKTTRLVCLICLCLCLCLSYEYWVLPNLPKSISLKQFPRVSSPFLGWGHTTQHTTQQTQSPPIFDDVSSPFERFYSRLFPIISFDLLSFYLLLCCVKTEPPVKGSTDGGTALLVLVTYWHSYHHRAAFEFYFKFYNCNNSKYTAGQQHSAFSNEWMLFVCFCSIIPSTILPGANPPWRTRADCHTVLITIGKNTPHRRSGSRTENREHGRAAEGNKWKRRKLF